MMEDNVEIATVAGGCFWCTEAIFNRLKGVQKVTPGYTGGELEAPTYEQVCSGTSGHAEAIEIKYDPRIISYETLLKVFFKLHDPTSLNRQGADMGTQYRSEIFYHDEQQKKMANLVIKKLSSEYKKPIVTRLSKVSKFYPAEEYHKDFYNRNRDNGYCQIVIDPKITKLYKEFKEVVI